MIDTWQLCPKCQGQGIVSKPPYIAGDVNQWSSTNAIHTCDICQGRKLISIFNGLPPTYELKIPIVSEEKVKEEIEVTLDLVEDHKIAIELLEKALDMLMWIGDRTYEEQNLLQKQIHSFLTNYPR